MPRIRWLAAVILLGFSFFGGSPWESLDWLFTARGRTAIVVAGLVIGFWPQIVSGLRDEWFKVRPPSRQRLRLETTELVQELFAWEAAHPEYERELRTLTAHEEVVAAMKRAESEAAGLRLWQEYSVQDMRERRAELRPFFERFGGPVRHLIGEYERFGLIVRGGSAGPMERHLSYFEWLLSIGRAGPLAQEFEALKRKL